MNARYVRSVLGALSTAAIVLAAAELTANGPETGNPIQPQDAQAQRAAPKPLMPLKVTIIVGRYQGEKRTASLPFTLMVNTNDRSSNLRMGSEVPYPVPVVGAGQPAVTTSYQYKSVGTSIDCSAETIPDEGRFRLLVTINDSQIFSDATGGTPTIVRGLASFQSFVSQSTLLLRDGQTMQYTTATDKVSGEVVKVDVTLSVVK